MFLDVDKASDNISWSFLSKVFWHLKCGLKFENWTQGIYKKQNAKMPINGVFTDGFTIDKGTRQGCLLSPLLFISAMELFLQSRLDKTDKLKD